MGQWYIDNGPESDVVLSCRVRVARNFRDIPFPHRATPEQRKKVIARTCDALFAGNGAMSAQFSYMDFEQMPDVDRQVLVERHLVSKELADAPNVNGAIINADENISIMLNEEDHLRIQCLGAGLQQENLWDTANKLDNLLAESINFAYDPKIGYLTCCPTNVGTGLRVSAMLHLPALVMTGYIRALLESVGKLGVAVRGLYGENTEALGNIFQVSNQITLGRSEGDIIAGIHSLIVQIVEQERSLRHEILEREGLRLEDRIMRSLGTLTHARILTTEETLQHLSNVRLGVDLGVLSDLPGPGMNALMLMIQPGTLQKNAGHPLKQEDRDTLRAELIRGYLRD